MLYHNLEGATLVNHFTLHHSSAKNDGRPFISTCVPQTVPQNGSYSSTTAELALILSKTFAIEATHAAATPNAMM
ncbi:hypothetical protein, partial [Rhizobium leguminosarum]|uniref:hypothetical protein n=1 Tax=Rhizobium leguminosarum TaxID=384 RepID=UPI003F9E3FB0